jgi:PAS domain S-box-containing protein
MNACVHNDSGQPEASAGTIFLAGGGEMGQRMRAHDWGSTQLGAPQSWPQSLKTVVRVMLDSRYAMWMLWGPELTFFCNDAYLPTVGIKRDWVLGARSDKVWEEIWPDIGPRIEQVLKRGVATWDERLQLFLERSGFPEETYHTFSYSPVYDDESRIAGMLCVVTEVTERVIGERQLRLLRDLAIRGAAGESVAQCCQRACQVLAQYPLDVAFAGLYLLADGAAGATLAAASRELPPQVLPADFARATGHTPWPVAQLLQNESAQELSDLPRLNLLIPAGPWPDPVQRALLLPLKGSGSQSLTGFLILGVSPRRALDEPQRAFLGLVAGQVAAALSEAQAYQAERERAEALAEIDRAKTVFFSNVSHEFRTPLTLLLGPLEVALAAIPAELPSHRGELQMAHRSAVRLLKLVNTLLDFSRIETGRIEAQFAAVDLCAVTRDLASVFRSTIERAGLKLQLRCAPLPAQSWVDEDMWEKIVLNLIANAFKYTLRGAIRVDLRGTDEWVELSVSDDGIGIPAAALPHLFERFYRVPGAVGRTHEGTGIGLSLVSELVKQHGGTISVASEEGRGSAFTVRIPTGCAHLPAERVRAHASRRLSAAAAQSFVAEAESWVHGEAAPEPTAAAGAGPASADTLHGVAAQGTPLVLVADDNSDMRAYVARLLAPQYRVLLAADGKEALEIMAGTSPDLLLSDVMMPHLDGLALLKAVRANPRTRELPVVLLSARAGEEAKIQGLGVGADDYLIKPFAARELLARVSAHLALARLRRETQRALTESEQRFRVALASSAVAFTLLRAVRDERGRIVDFTWQYLNEKAERLLGRTTDELAGRRLLATLPPTLDSPSVLEFLERVVEGGESSDLELPVARAAERLWFHHSAAKCGDGIVVWSADITERKRVETELRQSDRRKDEFLAVLAHELRTPLAPIRNAAGIASAAHATEAQLRWSQGVIERQVRHMARLLDDLLDVSRITRGKLELRKQRIDLRAVVDAAIETARPTIDARRHSLKVELPLDLPAVDADSLRLAQVISNLLTNAAKYTDAGGHIRLTVQAEELGVLIRVADDGIGIATDALPSIFQMFSQLRPALERSEGGLGIGLALVKGLVELHGGSVEARSAGSGRGSEFRVRLPRAPQAQIPTPDPQPAPLRAGAGSRRVLVADDNRDAAESLAMLLSLDGHEVRAAFDGVQALEVAAQFRPHIALLDVGMPKLNGYEVARRLRQQSDEDGIRLVAVTGWGQMQDKRRAHNAGFDRHLTKPVDPEVVLSLVRELPR